MKERKEAMMNLGTDGMRGGIVFHQPKEELVEVNFSEALHCSNISYPENPPGPASRVESKLGIVVVYHHMGIITDAHL